MKSISQKGWLHSPSMDLSNNKWPKSLFFFPFRLYYTTPSLEGMCSIPWPSWGSHGLFWPIVRATGPPSWQTSYIHLDTYLQCTYLYTLPPSYIYFTQDVSQHKTGIIFGKGETKKKWPIAVLEQKREVRVLSLFLNDIKSIACMPVSKKKIKKNIWGHTFV